ncbi:3-oxoacyl-ACP synthase III family protein [Aeoliella mucimassa]|uniref:Beta-ketoacyl-[acyl-carrier-protein] synthase III n=1 Tax=Aeoliella mucimassa TaxID=2527972 RepID=A0A518AL66_9BACT|nr:beta-ketoacyl-ACP synthase III [Aeoliella mucimassa]QDU55482.1 3-oxoacyl-[acyl-carrier-protein] synthase 3 [Aeoliella mucimassa]
MGESEAINVQVSRGPLNRLMGVQVIGSGSYLPDNVVTNEDLSQLGCDSDWIIQRTGIRERRHVPPGMTTSDLATEAAKRAIAAAGIDKSEIDLLILGTFTPDHPIPQTATTTQHDLGLSNCPAMDISAACAGFVYSFITAAQFVANGTSKYALVIGADANSRVLNPNDKITYPLFGDGAGAVVLAKGSDEQGMLAYTMGADGAGTKLLYREMGGAKVPYEPSDDKSHCPWLVSMEGRPIFKWAVRLIEDNFAQVCEAAKVDYSDVKLWFMHQANQRIIDYAVNSCGISSEQVPVHLDRYGNTSAGSIPIALDEALAAGRIERGDLVMFCGFGAGLSWATTLIRW